VNHLNYTQGYDSRASVTIYSEKFTGEVETKINQLSKIYNPSVNIVFFHVNGTEGKEFLKSKFKISKFPTIHLIRMNEEYDAKNAFQVKFDLDEEELIEEIDSLVTGLIIDTPEKTLTSRMVENAKEGKITYCFLYESGTPIPLAYRAMSGLKEFEKHFEFLAVSDPTPLIKKQF
jgi:hypothetical protein